VLKLNAYNKHNVDPMVQGRAIVISDRVMAERVKEKDRVSRTSAMLEESPVFKHSEGSLVTQIPSPAPANLTNDTNRTK